MSLDRNQHNQCNQHNLNQNSQVLFTMTQHQDNSQEPLASVNSCLVHDLVVLSTRERRTDLHQAIGKWNHSSHRRENSGTQNEHHGLMLYHQPLFYSQKMTNSHKLTSIWELTRSQ